MCLEEKVSLFFCEGSSDKVYNVQLEQSGSDYVVNFQYGRRGSSLTSGTKTASPLPYDKAKKIFDKLVAEKVGKGYRPSGDSEVSFVTVKGAGTEKKVLYIPQLLNVIDEDTVERYLRDDDFGLEEKKDGTHKMLRKAAGVVTVTNKKGIEVGYPKSFEEAVSNVEAVHLDGEDIAETFYAFDLLEYDGVDYRGKGYLARHKSLCEFSSFMPLIKVVPLFIGYADKKAEYDRLKAAGKEGVVFKRLDAPYTPGKGHSDMVKFKFYSTVSVRVCKGREGKRSIGMELLDGTQWIPVGNCTLPSDKTVVPGEGTFCEIRYLYAYKGGSIYQPTYLGPRDDVDSDECLLSQLKYKAEEV